MGSRCENVFFELRFMKGVRVDAKFFTLTLHLNFEREKESKSILSAC